MIDDLLDHLLTASPTISDESVSYFCASWFEVGGESFTNPEFQIKIFFAIAKTKD